MFTTTHLFSFTRNLALAEFFHSADKNENENNSASAKSLVRDKSSFCLKRKWNEELDQNIGFLNNLEIDIIDKILKVTLVNMNSVKICNLNAMEISLLKVWKLKRSENHY